MKFNGVLPCNHLLDRKTEYHGTVVDCRPMPKGAESSSQTSVALCLDHLRKLFPLPGCCAVRPGFQPRLCARIRRHRFRMQWGILSKPLAGSPAMPAICGATSSHAALTCSASSSTRLKVDAPLNPATSARACQSARRKSGALNRPAILCGRL